MVRTGLLLLLVLSVALVAGQSATTAPVAYAWYDPSYVSPPPGEIASLQLSKLGICKLGGCTTVYKADVDVWGFQNFDGNVGLLLALKGSWVTAWSSKRVETNTVTTFSLSTNTTREDLIAIAIPLWRSSEQWIQSLEVTGFDQYCTTELRAPKIREVREDWLNERTVRLSIYINSPGQRGSFTARIYYGGEEVYYVYKSLKLDVGITACHILRIIIGPVTFLKDGVYTIRVEYSSDVGRDAVEKSVRVGRQYQVRVRVVHVDGSAAADARVCVGGMCQYADYSGVAVFQLSEGSYVVSAEKEYDVAGTKIRYSGERNIYVSSNMSLNVELNPERCLYLRQFRLNSNEAAPGGVVGGYAEFVLARCCANCTAHLVVYDWNYREITRLWDGQIEAHRVITKSFSVTAPNTPGTYCVLLNFFLGLYTIQKLPPGEEVGRACFTVKEMSRARTEIYVTNATIPVGGAGVVRVVLDRAPGGLSGFSLRFTTRTTALLPGYCPHASLCVPADVRIEGVKFPEWAGLSDWRRIDEYTVELKAVDLRDAVRPGAQNVVLAEITVRALALGVAVASVVNATIDDDGGRPVAVVVKPGVVYVSGCPRPVAGVMPRDLNGDGFYEDLNGNGRLDYDDVVRLFRYFDDPAIRECWQLYDFNRNGRLDYDDIVALFRMVR
jgi:PKD repeat protein